MPMGTGTSGTKVGRPPAKNGIRRSPAKNGKKKKIMKK